MLIDCLYPMSIFKSCFLSTFFSYSPKNVGMDHKRSHYLSNFKIFIEVEILNSFFLDGKKRRRCSIQTASICTKSGCAELVRF